SVAVLIRQSCKRHGLPHGASEIRGHLGRARAHRADEFFRLRVNVDVDGNDVVGMEWHLAQDRPRAASRPRARSTGRPATPKTSAASRAYSSGSLKRVTDFPSGVKWRSSSLRSDQTSSSSQRVSTRLSTTQLWPSVWWCWYAASRTNGSAA